MVKSKVSGRRVDVETRRLNLTAVLKDLDIGGIDGWTEMPMRLVNEANSKEFAVVAAEVVRVEDAQDGAWNVILTIGRP